MSLVTANKSLFKDGLMLILIFEFTHITCFKETAMIIILKYEEKKFEDAQRRQSLPTHD